MEALASSASSVNPSTNFNDSATSETAVTSSTNNFNLDLPESYQFSSQMRLLSLMGQTAKNLLEETLERVEEEKARQRSAGEYLNFSGVQADGNENRNNTNTIDGNNANTIDGNANNVNSSINSSLVSEYSIERYLARNWNRLDVAQILCAFSLADGVPDIEVLGLFADLVAANKEYYLDGGGGDLTEMKAETEAADAKTEVEAANGNGDANESNPGASGANAGASGMTTQQKFQHNRYNNKTINNSVKTRDVILSSFANLLDKNSDCVELEQVLLGGPLSDEIKEQRLIIKEKRKGGSGEFGIEGGRFQGGGFGSFEEIMPC
jgi:hypothetical protein